MGEASDGPRPRGGWPRTKAALRPVLVAGALLVVYFAVPLDHASTPALVLLVLGLVVLLGLMVLQVRAVTVSPYPRLRAIEVVATVVPFFLVLFSSVYVALSRSNPSAFSEPLDRFDALYFAVTTFATVGFGDIVARTEGARLAVTLQMVGGLILVGLLARVLVGAMQRGLRRLGREDGSEGDDPG
ncbi:potassium channel family protein [Georgenia ruanii]|uniref:Two pore domain potassium channel family protein n=1 Tax=Georgenia ruanii TaxID=348442 RepID=A0A7J9V026_9MICO|nr:potassium channel family protein [Georgenia ruanii]MPV90218.1 two pore domain potassium channel family protein [Georgenia ruanii]